MSCLTSTADPRAFGIDLVVNGMYIDDIGAISSSGQIPALAASEMADDFSSAAD